MVDRYILDSAGSGGSMAIYLTKDERLVLRHLASGKSIEEIAATLDWRLEAVRWTCTHPLTTWVLDELEANTTPPDPLWRVER